MSKILKQSKKKKLQVVYTKATEIEKKIDKLIMILCK
jgi:hypothetical protein